MIALFADTFYWIALADFNDGAHPRALALASERADLPIITTDEVLAEYLTFFATAPEPMRRKALAKRAVYSRRSWCSRHSAEPRLVAFRHVSLRSAARQRLQPDGLYLNAGHAEGRAD
jgi:hypothetical protein